MTRPTYAQQLKDPRWQRRRLEILNRAEFKCTSCACDDKTLHVHHTIYRKGAQPWEYADHELVCLCEDCHEEETQIRAELAEWLAFFDSSDIHQLVGYAKAIFARRAELYEELDAKEIVVGSAEQAMTLGVALGLSEIEGHYLLATPKPLTAKFLRSISWAARLVHDDGITVKSIDELVALAEKVPKKETEL